MFVSCDCEIVISFPDSIPIHTPHFSNLPRFFLNNINRLRDNTDYTFFYQVCSDIDLLQYTSQKYVSYKIAQNSIKFVFILVIDVLYIIFISGVMQIRCTSQKYVQSFIAKRVISILVNLRYLRFKLLKYKEYSKKICNTFDHNFKNIHLYNKKNISLERYYFV